MFQSIKRRIFAGLIAIVPIAVTFWILKFLFIFLDGFAAPLLKQVDIEIPGLGIILTLLFIFILGILITNVLGKTIFSWGEKILDKLPFVNTIYNTIKQITSAFSSSTVKSFEQVVFIQYPRKGLWTMCFVTNQSKNENGESFYHVFVPTTPNPTSGVFIIVPQKDAIHPDISVEDGLKAIISGGILDSGISLSKNLPDKIS
ncbi:MAG: DUF502 domain-containing protein [Candidatus Marinimicrobia bacterium]|jgi:uncharacterized membrane protein|nr:DUF502 domain-containing protein [Candidatus Neomarinimicrobiota bacterium]MBT4149472.1 DUF502 domain-containing protein [Candidatus Neomarinimicrobiota bacterium]MBT7524927.1 DUF502 domain-containing protein [Candidatus Neomarinimicrobiota bacterium]MDG2367483.1 DUF502 domain-containing protein [Candidatus Neomarinimicrobiota bacterium]|tara:strand:+ start:228 stop:833 length:606 start_codon:yes stop_codon:yes gene_type:complete